MKNRKEKKKSDHKMKNGTKNGEKEEKLRMAIKNSESTFKLLFLAIVQVKEVREKMEKAGREGVPEIASTLPADLNMQVVTQANVPKANRTIAIRPDRLWCDSFRLLSVPVYFAPYSTLFPTR